MTDKIDQMSKDINKKFGANTFVDASFILDNPKRVIPLSPVLDIQLNGGIPEGSWVISSGQPKCGKSTTALQFAANCMRVENGSKEVFYGDVEGRLKAMNLNGIVGLDLTKFHVIKSTREKILSAQDFLDIFDTIVKTHPECLLIIDSSSALCDAAEQIEDVNGSKRSAGPKLMANFCRKLGNVVPVNNTIIWIIQHLIANTSGYGPKWMEDGGQKIQYQVDVKIRAKMFESWKIGENEVGQKVTWDVVTSALGKPHGKAESYIRFGKGIDYVQELIELAIELDIINQKGAWYSMGENKWQGKEKIHEFLTAHSEVLDEVKQKLAEML